VAEAEAVMPRRSLSLSLLVDESHQAAIVRLVRSCTVHLLRIISICCTRHADDMQLSAVSTFCNLLQSLTISGYLSDSGKLSLAILICFVIFLHSCFYSVRLRGRLGGVVHVGLVIERLRV